MVVILVEGYVCFRVIDLVEGYVYYDFVEVYLLQCYIWKNLKFCLLECFI